MLAQPDPDAIKVCYIGTVAQTGGRNYPIHWGRCGDPLKISIYDHYAISKTVAERIFVESGIKNWVVLRQTGILYPSILNNLDPIMYHIPHERCGLNGAPLKMQAESCATLCWKIWQEISAKDFWNHFTI